MNRNDFLEMMDNHQPFNSGLLGEFSELISLFPYFQSAHMLYLKGLNRNEDIRFSSQLRNSALYIADREVLYNFLNMPVNNPEVKEETLPPADNNISHDDNVSIKSEPATEEIKPSDNDAVIEVVAPAVLDNDTEPAVIDSDTEKEQTVIDIAKNSDEIITEIEKETVSSDEESLKEAEEEPPLVVMEGFEEDIPEIETGSIPSSEQGIDLLELDTDKGNYADEPTAQPEVRLSQADLIERFIILNPRIEPNRDKKDVPVEDRSVPVYDESGFVTETLARIYIGQGYYSKAIDIFEKLTLKFPEKSSYFAAQIEKVKEYLKK